MSVEVMVNHRCHYHSKNLSSFRNRNSSFLSLTLYVILLCALSVFIFMIYSKDVLDDEHTIPLFRVDTPDSKQLLDDQLWEAPFGHDLHPCVKSPSKYIGNFLLLDRFVFVGITFILCSYNFLWVARVRYKCSWLLVLCEEVFSCPFLIVPLTLAFCMLLTKIRLHLEYSAMPVWDRYLTVRCNGGLNQMRTGIADMVAVARIMNATLVIPQLDKRSFWQDTSTFSNIFDELHFIKSLQQDVRILSELPKELESLPRARKHFTLWSGMSYYEEMIELWKEYQVIHVAKSDSRLANNDLPLDIQRLRCRALFHALHFSPAIEDLGKKLVERLRSHAGRYIALHLRYEKDMLSFTGCTYGLTDAESEELKIMREKTNHWKIKVINSTEQRIAGLCPLTPKEVGIFLQALGYPPSTLIYIAAGEIYGGDTHISELTSRFPNIVYKEMLATKEELRMFSSHASSQTAAIDYKISIESDVFVPSHSGNMARAVEGHRRFLGHRKTITPDRKSFVELFDKLEAGQLEMSSLAHLVKQLHKNRLGAPRRRRGAPPGIRGRARLRLEESFYQNPYPECICKSPKVQG